VAYFGWRQTRHESLEQLASHRAHYQTAVEWARDCRASNLRQASGYPAP